jgi:hypothetical protein
MLIDLHPGLNHYIFVLNLLLVSYFSHELNHFLRLPKRLEIHSLDHRYQLWKENLVFLK